ncbi:MAG: arsenic resistance N-acetyltransferase ArsN2 [Gemmatimonadales bacterium]
MPEQATVPLRAAAEADVGAVREMLRDAKLHVEGLEEQFPQNYVVAESGGTLVGAMGVEVYGRYGLLRSAVVAPALRGTGLGKQLTANRVAWAKARHLEALYLLTVTAASFFARRGFAETPRASAPAEVRKSLEFAKLCGSTAVCMRMDLAK